MLRPLQTALHVRHVATACLHVETPHLEPNTLHEVVASIGDQPAPVMNTRAQQLEVLTTPQLAERLNCNVKTVRAMVDRDQIPAFRTHPKGPYRFVLEDVLEAIGARNNAHPQDPLPRKVGRPRMKRTA